MLLCGCVAPCRAEWLQRQPRFSKFASLNPIGLHACPTTRLAGLCVSPLERKPKPRSIAFKRVIVNDDTYIRPLLTGLGDLGRVGLPCDCPIASFVMTDVVFGDAARQSAVCRSATLLLDFATSIPLIPLAHFALTMACRSRSRIVQHRQSEANGVGRSSRPPKVEGDQATPPEAQKACAPTFRHRSRYRPMTDISAWQ